VADSRLVRVNSEDELQEGMHVLLRPCRNCSADHWFDLIQRKTGKFLNDQLQVERRVAWVIKPGPACVSNMNRFDTAWAIQHRILYKVEQDDEAPAIVRAKQLEDA
jgi:hypothetical protein